MELLSPLAVESEVDASGKERVEELIRSMEAVAGEMPGHIKSFFREYGPNLFKLGVWHAMRTWDCYPKT